MDLGLHWDYIVDTAQRRLKNNQTPKQRTRWGEQLEVLGAAGELTARAFFGQSLSLHDKFDGGFDLEWYGYTIDVKTTRRGRRHRFLRWPLHVRIQCDIVLLAIVDLASQRGEVVGWLWGHELPLLATKNTEIDEPCYEVSTRELREMWELLELEAK